MGNRSSTGSRTLNVTRMLPAFVLSAILGIAFVAVVNKTHNLFASGDQTGVGIWQEPWTWTAISQLNIAPEDSR